MLHSYKVRVRLVNTAVIDHRNVTVVAPNGTKLDAAPSATS